MARTGKLAELPLAIQNVPSTDSSDEATQQSLHDMVKRCYKTRSEIVHGRWEEGPEIDDRMGETEAIVRTVVRNIADKPGMLGGVSVPKDDWLEEWVQSKAFVPPPLP